jgi:hypothetical protein
MTIRQFEANKNLDIPIPVIETNRHSNAWLWLTVPIAILLMIAAGGGVFRSSLYRDNPTLLAQAIGQDFISLVVVFPTLIISAVFASRGSPRARLVWLGALAYLVYTYASFAFDIRFNSLFLVYVALLGCSLYALIGGLATTNMAGMKAHFTEKTPVKAVSIYLAVIMVLFYLMWLSEIVPALIAGQIPQNIQESGTPSNSVYVLDMAWILPAFAIAAVNLWRKRKVGYTLAGALLSFLTLLILAIMGMLIVQVWEGLAVVGPQVMIFGVLLAITLGMLIWYMRGLCLPRV